MMYCNNKINNSTVELIKDLSWIDDPHLYSFHHRLMFVKRWSRADRSAKEFRDIGLKDRKLSD